MNEKNTVLNEIKQFVFLTVAAAIIAFNLRSFVDTGGLFPGGFSGVALLLQRSAEKFLNLQIPYSVIYIPLNLFPAYIGLKHIGKRFTFYSFYVVFLSSFLADMIPEVPITYDTLLISVFGGIINGAAIGICLIAGASAGGTDFISIYLSEKKGIDVWNYIFMANVVILTLAGIIFGFDAALYSIIFQFCTTQVIQMLYTKYQKDTLLIITSKPEEVYELIRIATHHDATLFEGVGCFKEEERHMLYSVVGRGEVEHLVGEIHKTDEGAFINVIRTDQINGRFYKSPTK